MQIFRGEEEVVDVFISHNRRKSNASQFGFVRFKKMEETMNAINNLNSIKVKGKVLKVSFSKYDRNGMIRSSEFMKVIRVMMIWGVRGDRR